MKNALTSILLLACLSFAAAAADKNVKYVPPEGFGGHKWGDLRGTFDRLPERPIGVGAGYMLSREKTEDFQCVPVVQTGQITGAVGGCDFQATLLRLRKTFEGGGTYVLSEYTIEGQGFRFGDEADAVVLHPVVYEFCANWPGAVKNRGSEPPNFDELNKFCGVRFLFESETREQLRTLPAEHVTTYDRMLDKLIAKFGRPKGFLRRGRVLIETLDGDSTDEADRKFSIWRWCPAVGDGFKTECTASVTLSLDPNTGQGSVLYATPLLWEYAYARENFGFKGDKMYRLLHAKQ
ncbi:MAG TPA: hypothetical protein VMF52_18690 [Steroidobacteraceae bacterium]|nr:hypothetical protein [Steroidobacteraceae bacterium]